MDNVLEMKRPDPFAKADAAHQKGMDAYIEWGQEMAKLNESGHTQQELGERYDCSQSHIRNAIKVGTDPRISSNTTNLPKDKTVLYLLSTLDDKEFKEIASPDLRQHEIKEYKQAKKGVKRSTRQKYSFQRTLAEYGIMNCGQIRQKLADAGITDRSNPENESKIREWCIKYNAEHGIMPVEAEPFSLTQKDQKALDKALVRLQAEFHQEVAAEVERRLDDARERKLQAAIRQAKSAQELRDTWKARVDSCKAFLHLFEDNWRTVASSIHPDRPERTKEQLENASAAMNKMKAAFERIALDKWGN